jgi:hypothetical protein
MCYCGDYGWCLRTHSSHCLGSRLPHCLDAIFEVFHLCGWYPEQQLAAIVMVSPQTSFWVLSTVVAIGMWVGLDYAFYRRKGGYKPGKSATEITAIINALGNAHAEAVTLVADTLPDSDFHRNRLAVWTMDTMRIMKQLDMPQHEIFSFQNPAGLPDQNKCLRERKQLLRSLIEKYMREK